MNRKLNKKAAIVLLTVALKKESKSSGEGVKIEMV